MKRTTPTAVFGESKYCPGCGHGIFDRIFAECMDEYGLVDKAIGMIDIACSNNVTRYIHSDYIVGPHGRILETASAAKRVRPECFVYARGGDGCAYAIGLAETYHAAMRNENICAFIINNGNYGMTGGQMAPTTLVGQITTSSPAGKDPAQFGYPIDVKNLLTGLNIAYLARGSVSSPAEIRKTKRYVSIPHGRVCGKSGYEIPGRAHSWDARHIHAPTIYGSLLFRVGPCLDGCAICKDRLGRKVFRLRHSSGIQRNVRPTVSSGKRYRKL